MASGRGLGNTRTSIVELYLYHGITNFLPGIKILAMVALFCAHGHSLAYLFWPMVAGVCYVAAPVLYNPKPTHRALLEVLLPLPPPPLLLCCRRCPWWWSCCCCCCSCWWFFVISRPQPSVAVLFAPSPFRVRKQSIVQATVSFVGVALAVGSMKFVVPSFGLEWH